MLVFRAGRRTGRPDLLRFSIGISLWMTVVASSPGGGSACAQDAAAPARADSAAAATAAADSVFADVAFDGGMVDTIFVSAAAIRGGMALPVTPSVTTLVRLDEERGRADLGELLGGVAGVQVRRFGGLGSYALPSVRGSTAAQVPVYVDGLPLADAQTGVVDLSALPLERYAAAEVHRGLVPAGFGGAGAAGAVNLISRDLPVAGSDLRLYGGGYGELGARASLADATTDGGRRGLFLLHGRRADNRYAYLDHNQTFATSGDDTVRTRANAPLAEFGAYGLGELNGGAGTLRVSGGFYRQDAGRPGPLGFPSPHAAMRRDRWDGRLTVADPRRLVTLDAAVNRRHEWLYDADAEVGYDPPGNTESTSDDLTTRATWAPTWRWHASPSGGDAGLELALVAGGGWAGQWYDERHAGEARPQRERTTVSAFASLTARLGGPRLQVTPGWRWQRVRDDFPPVPPLPWLPEEPAVVHRQDAASPSVGAAWEAVPATLILEAHWHESLRQPSWVELFGQPGGLEGNRELVPEEITGRDVGVSLRAPGGAADLRVTLFEQVAERTITWLQSSRYTVRAANLGRTRTRGIEVEARADLPGGVSLQGNLTHQDARDRGPDPAYAGKQLPYLPATEAFLRAGCERAGWAPAVTLAAMSSNPRDRYNQPEQQAPARAVVNVSLARTWDGGVWGDGRRATLAAEVVNVGDDDVYDVEGFPLPGRSLRVSLHWR